MRLYFFLTVRFCNTFGEGKPVQTSVSPARIIRCPDCRARLAAHAARCVCGYVSPDANVAGVDGDNLVTKAERLYENYLSARVMRARKTVIDLRARRMQNVRDEALTHLLRTAEKELRALEMQLVAQNTKENAPDARTTEEAVTEPTDLPSASPPGNDPIPSEPMRFRASQSARAVGITQPKSKDSFTNAQARRADQVLENADPSLKVCPECDATLSPHAPQCVCGYNFRLAKRLPAFLSDEEIRALRGR